MLIGNSNEEKIWNYLIAYGLTKEGAAGLMGNIYAESSYVPNNLQNTANQSLGMSDAEFTAAVDNGTYTNFIYDGFGYGLAQWTFWSLKQGLYNYWKTKNCSIGDLEMQLEYLMLELSKDYSRIMEVLKTTNDVRTASTKVLMEYERPGSTKDPNSQACKDTQELRYKYAMEVYNKFYDKGGYDMPNYTNSPLVTCTLITPNQTSPRTHSIDRLTIHVVVGQLTALRIAEIFQDPGYEASCNYAIGKDGSVALIVEEKDRSWCSSSRENDHRAVTIENASDKTEPYFVNDTVFNKLLDLCTDICQRNGKKKLLWFGDKDRTLAYNPAPDEMVMTVHRWFKNKSCPGNYLYNLHPLIAEEVTRRLAGEAPRRFYPSQGDTSGSTGSQQPAPQAMYRVRRSWNDPSSQVGAYVILENAKKECDKHPGYTVYDANGVGVYGADVPAFKPYMVQVDINDLNIRTGPGTNYPKTGKFTGKGKFTIVEESNGWGKLKSGVGWISLAYAKRI